MGRQFALSKKSTTTAAEEEFLTLQALEARQIRRALARTGGVIDGEGGAGRLLGLHPNTLRSRMKKHGIKRPE